MYPKTEVLEMSDINKDTWDQFLQKHKGQATVFHTQEWMITLQDAFNYRPKYLIYSEDEITFNAAMPFMIDTRLGMRNYLSMPLDTYGGVVGDPNAIPTLMRNFMELPGIGVRWVVDYSRQKPNVNCVSPPRIRTSTEHLDLTQSLDDIWNGMDARNQKQIKAAGKTEVSCRIATTGEDRKAVWRLLQPSVGVHGGVHPDLTDAIFSRMIPAGLCIPYLTTVEGIPVCASLFFAYGDMAMYWAMALHKEGRVFHAHYQLMWQAIQDFKLAGYKTLNLGATPQTTDTVLPWKKSWGTKTYRYVKYQKVPTALRPILKIKELVHG